MDLNFHVKLFTVSIVLENNDGAEYIEFSTAPSIKNPLLWAIFLNASKGEPYAVRARNVDLIVEDSFGMPVPGDYLLLVSDGKLEIYDQHTDKTLYGCPVEEFLYGLDGVMHWDDYRKVLKRMQKVKDGNYGYKHGKEQLWEAIYVINDVGGVIMGVDHSGLTTSAFSYAVTNIDCSAGFSNYSLIY